MSNTRIALQSAAQQAELPQALISQLPDMSSPSYVIVEQKLQQNLERLQQVQDRTGCSILLALKAYACTATFPLIAQYLSGVTASSINEARLARPYFKDVHVYSPAYTSENITQLTELADHMVFNSLSQYKTFAKQCHQKKSDLSI